MTEQKPSRFLVTLYILVGIGGAVGFGTKVFEFAKSFLTGESSFALPGLTVYFMVASGFTCLFLWATLRGQFRQIEGPKHWMLEREQALDSGLWLDEEEAEKQRAAAQAAAKGAQA